MNLTRTNWPLGWSPHIDERNGTPEGLLRADNLQLNEFGVLSLVNSYQKLNSTDFGAEIRQIYSKTIQNTKHRYIVLSNGRVLKSSNNFVSTTELVSGKAFTHVGFSSTLGQVLICAGNARIKDDGTTIRQLGLNKPDSAPTKIDTDITQVNFGPAYSNWVAEYGTLSPPTEAWNANAIYTEIATNNYWGIAQVNQTFDLSSIGGNPGTDDDEFSIFISGIDGGTYTNVKLEFLLNNPLYPAVDTYSYEWLNIDRGFEILATETGYTGGITLTVKRKDMVRSGTNPNLDWSHVKLVKVLFIQGASGIGYWRDFKVISKFLVGKSYEYASMHVANLGTYVSKSPLSAASEIVSPVGGQIKIQVDSPITGDDADTQINELWLFRRASIRGDVVPIGSPPILDAWYQVAVNKYPADGLTFTDLLSDVEALELNIKADPYLISIKDIEEEIIGIVTGYYDRTLYITAKLLYLSEILNPESIDTRNTLKFEGGDISENLWITKTSLGVVLIGTTQDIFELSGTFVNLPDGSIDASVKALGVTYPPLGFEFDVFSNTLFYVAKDGVRTIAPGGQSELVSSPHLDLLFNKTARHGLSSFEIYQKHSSPYPIAVTQNNIFISLPQGASGRNVVVYDRITQTWQFRWTNPISFFVEEDGTILAGYGIGDAYVREFNVGKLIDGMVGQTIRILTVFDFNQQPRNRKDWFTIKINADTGNQPIKFWAKVDAGAEVYLGEHSFNGLDEFFIQLAGIIETAKAIQLRIEGYWLERFYFYNLTIEYNPFPEQLNYLRIPNDNLGTLSRKRITNYAFVIDTLGNTIAFTPILDGVSLSGANVIFNGKRTFIHYFKSETIGTDIGGVLDGDIFEYYGLNLEEIVSEKLPVPVKYLVIPASDYGNPNRKRHSSYKFAINTRGYNVRFTPRLDGVNKTALTVNTIEKRIAPYYFTTDTIAIDIGGILESLEDQEFEFYGVIIPQQLEVLPPMLKEFRIPESNLGIAARKRLRTLPLEINTNGYDVVFTPIVDGVSGTPTTLNTMTRKTAFHYFSTDSFGVDYSGELVGPDAFEFYGLLKPEDVEILPVGKKYDQIGPLRFDRIGKLLACRLRLIAEASETVNVRFFDEDGLSYGTPIHTEALSITANQDEIYEFNFPKTVKGSTIRVTIGPSTNPFHRYDMQLKVNLSGMDADPKWVRVK